MNMKTILKLTAAGGFAGLAVYTVYKKRHVFGDVLENFRRKEKTWGKKDGENLNNTAYPTYVSEEGDTEIRHLVMYIEQSTTNLDICLYSLNSDMLEQALVKVCKKGVKVRLLLERKLDNSKRGFWDKLTGIHIRFKTHHAAGPSLRNRAQTSDLLNQKFAIVDNVAVVSGSLNWTLPGVRGNSENEMKTTHEATVAKFRDEFEKFWDRSVETFLSP